MTRAMLTAILFASPPPPGSASALTVGGMTVLDRQIRLVRQAGAGRVCVVGGAGPDGVADAAALALLIGGTGDVLMLDPGVILDERIVRAVVAATAPTIATWPAGRGTERIDTATTAAGIALYPAELVRATAAGLGDWDLAATLLRTALAAGAARVDLAAVPLYDAGRERDVPLVWALPDEADSAAEATTALLAGGWAVRPGWPARFVYPPVEEALVRLLLPLSIPADAVTGATLALALGAGAAFAAGWLWTGLTAALLCGPLAGVAALLARTRVEATRLGRAGAVVAVADYGWYAALGAHFAATGHEGAWPITALVAGFALATSEQGAFVRRLSGRPLTAAGAVERNLALFGAGRDTRLWALLPFAAAGLWYAGVAVLAAYTAATFFAVQRRSFIRLGASPSAR